MSFVGTLDAGTEMGVSSWTMSCRLAGRAETWTGLQLPKQHSKGPLGVVIGPGHIVHPLFRACGVPITRRYRIHHAHDTGSEISNHSR
jgi:hypothetical protein